MPDANDILQSGGPEGLRRAIEAANDCDIIQLQLELGSDQEVAERLARDLMSRFTEVIYTEGDVYAWAQTHWTILTEANIHQLLKRYDGCEYQTDGGSSARYKLNDTKRKSVLKLLKLELSEPDFFANAPIGVACASGFITITEDGEAELAAHSPDQRQRHFIDVSWIPDAIAEFDEASLLGQLCCGCFRGNPEFQSMVAAMGELIGAALFGLATRTPEPKTIILLGESAANGKSQWLELMRALLPKSAVSSVTPDELEKEQRRAQLSGSRLNTADELGHEAITSDKFKAVVSGDRTSGKVVYREPFEFNPEALHVFATNVLPVFKNGMDRGVRRRLHVLVFERTIPVEERVVDIGRKVATEEAELLLAFAVAGACRLIMQGHFTNTADGKRRLAEWIIESDLVSAFFKDEDVIEITGHKEDRYTAKAVYAAFRRWAELEGVQGAKIPVQSQFTGRAKTQGLKGVSVTRTGKSGNHFNGLRLKQNAERRHGKRP